MGNAVDTLSTDLRQSGRVLWHRPRFAVTAIFVLTLGVGAGTAIFNSLNAIMLKPLPYRDPDRLAMLWMVSPRNSQVPVSWADLDRGTTGDRYQVIVHVGAAVQKPTAVVTPTIEDTVVELGHGAAHVPRKLPSASAAMLRSP